ncbi:MAG TPA: methyltransferase [Candidatus Acidoferrum sp.]|nr:methyltransferase [Candidatus Acidoferrum sp.]
MKSAATTQTLPPSNDDREIWECWLSQFRLPVVTVADEAGTFAALSGAAKSTAALAQEIGADARALGIHLGLLAATGFVERRDGLWRATALSRRWLHPEAEGYYGPALHGYRQSNPLHAQLLSTLRTGERPDSHASAADEWERGEMPPELASIITAYMNAHSRAAALALAEQPLFADVRLLLDVGGGSGSFSIALARAWPSLSATILEIAPVCVEAERYIAVAGVTRQVTTLARNMFTEAWPTGHDAHFFSNIFHDWSEATCQKLADAAFAALPSGGRILLHEMLMDDDHCGPWPVAAFSLLMLLGTKGRQYSLPDLKAMLQRAGFVDISALRTGASYYSLVSARKP